MLTTTTPPSTTCCSRAYVSTAATRRRVLPIPVDRSGGPVPSPSRRSRSVARTKPEVTHVTVAMVTAQTMRLHSKEVLLQALCSTHLLWSISIVAVNLVRPPIASHRQPITAAASWACPHRSSSCSMTLKRRPQRS